MKKQIINTIAAMILAVVSYAQAPNSFKYQAVIRDASGVILNNQNVGLQFTIQQGMPGGTAVYTETFAPTTNDYGLVNAEIGTGTTTDDFSTIDWSAGPYFIETAVDVTGGTTYAIMGTSQLLSVPYALHAKTAEVALNGGSSHWTLNGSDISNNNVGNVGVGLANPFHQFAVGREDSTSTIAVGHIGNFNEIYSGQLVFSEDLDFGDDCGLRIVHNGASNSLYFTGGCTTFGDTAIRVNRNGYTNIRNLRLGTSYDNNSTIPLTVDGLSSFNGDMTITGNLNVSGNIAKGGGTFKIDHPLDPANLYLTHSFVESPEMMNVFSGNVVTNADGFATVEMPDYFQAANKDFRYQLTVIGSFAQAIVKEKISGNHFVVQTNEPNIEVSWMVTSVRSDKYAEANRIVPVSEKEIKGSYLHPELYDQPADLQEQKLIEKAEQENQKHQIGADGQ